ncbi:MAG: choline oxidase [Rhizobiales bacterium]|nr:choline oxidase [Hyphomicrobiales bacterium]
MTGEPESILEVDVAIVGGGSAGCIIARRLADARPDWRILLIEAGPADEGDPTLTDISRLDEQRPELDWGFRAAPHEGGPAELAYARARALGGCGNHNDCAFLIPPPSDFEAWVAAGARGWGPNDVAPFFARIEERVHVERHPPLSPVSRAFIAAGNELGLPTRDFRDGIEEGVGAFPLNARGAIRQSSSVAYLHPIDLLPANLILWTETLVERILFEDRRATAIETTRGGVSVAGELVLSAGAIQTPQLLMVSGIGPAGALAAHSIPVLHDVAGIGSHLLDHPAAAVTFELAHPVPAWSITPFEATMLIRIDADAPAPDVLFHFGLRVREKYEEDPRLGRLVNGVKLSPNVTRARSEGYIGLTGPRIGDAPRISLCYLSDPEGYDRRILRAAMRFARRIMEAPSFRAIASREVAPGPGVTTDAELDAHIDRVVETVYHPSGTCRMGDPRDPRSVVAPDLGVCGLANVTVADASVFPTMVTTNINSAVMMIGERAAALLAARHLR